MDLKAHYDKLYSDAIRKIRSGGYETDPLIGSPYDKRLGLTLIIRPDIRVKNKFRQFLDELKTLEPRQYYYPASDIHVTVMSVISAYPGFDLTRIRPGDYIRLIEKSIARQKPFEINFNGITASPSCIMIRGFFTDQTLNTIRDNLRTNFRDSGLQQSMDVRYPIQTAHSTVVRFREKLNDQEKFVRLLEKYSGHDFGTFTAGTLEFVCNDWYQRKNRVRELYRFRLQE